MNFEIVRIAYATHAYIELSVRQEVHFKIQSGFRRSSAVSVARALVLDARPALERCLQRLDVCGALVQFLLLEPLLATSRVQFYQLSIVGHAYQLATQDCCRLAAYDPFVRTTSIQLGILFFSILYCPLVNQDMPKLMNETMVNFSLKYCIQEI